jgi:O-antigen/teichoic acid export membrane protein
MQHITIIESLRKTIDLLVCLSLLSLGYGIFEMSVGLVAGQILVLLVIWLLFRHAFGVAPRPALTWTGALSLIPQALPYGLLLVFYGVIQSTDSIMLATLRTEEEVGWYGVILRVINILSLIPLMCASAMFPTTARLYETDREQTVTIVRGLLRLMTFLALPIAVGVTLESPAIIRFLFTDAFLPAASPFKIITWSTGLYFLTIPLVLFLSAIGRQHYVTATLGAAALSNVLFNFILIPVWGMNGAATATVIAEILILTFCALETRKHIQKPGIVRHLVQSVIGCVAMTLVIWPLQGFHVLPVTGLGALVYIGVLFLIGALNRHDLKDIYRIIKRN